MTFEEKLELLKKRRKEIEKIRSEINKTSKEIFDEFCKNIFFKYSKLNSFSWSQYTPYFNDGDVCVFSVYTDYLKINGQPAEESDWFSEKTITDWGKWNPKKKIYENRLSKDNDKFDSELRAANDEIVDFLNLFDNDFFQENYGDHAEITITPNGLNIQEYDHE